MKRIECLVAVPILALGSVFGTVGDEGPVRIGLGDYLPELSFSFVLGEDDARYLGLRAGEPLNLNKIDADLVIIELFITQCFKCEKQVPIYEEAFKAVSSDSEIRDRVAFIGIGIGNSITSVRAFKETHSVSFPLVPDDSLSAFKQLGEPGRAPYTLFARKTEDGRRLVVSTHGGPFRSAKDLLDEIRVTLEYELSLIRGEPRMQEVAQDIECVISAEEIRRLITQTVDTLSGKTRRIDLVKLKSKDSVYVIRAGYGRQRRKLFAKLESRRTICGDCHDTHFVYVFDEVGKIVDFIPISLSKIANMDWDEDDVEFMKDRLIGHSVLGGEGFDLEVDAVTGATITSILIFDSLRNGKRLYQELVAEGHLP
ncbi:hypothetical protein E3J62_07180 [candidate division TA06 bacterium]|uniref:Redoxin domain-containing protein n=1 Tax=candidate division TA06 bacterium TaxID=2250710 RepID=A0A523UST6_UNCT6|nr:MAG: hypothetical protein E3J62_07180 [candidate division TA06 bacterium]